MIKHLTNKEEEGGGLDDGPMTIEENELGQIEQESDLSRRTGPLQKINVVVAIFMALVAGGTLFLVLLISPPKGFAVNNIFRVHEGESVRQIGERLHDEGFIRSSMFFRAVLRLSRNDTRLLSGDYIFTEPIRTPTVISRLVNGVSGITAVRVTIPEGSSNREIADILEEKLPDFNRALFFSLAREHEGYLFPDTYFLSPRETPEDVIKRMRQNFTGRLSALAREIEASGHDLGDVVTMASLIEKEAGDADSRTLVSGILWKRLDQDIPLQVDAVFLYLLGKRSDELTEDDLNTDSPYNTYRYAGLPAGPIGNPGLAAIESALRPEKSPYLFYLSDKDGGFHYAIDFDEHKRNKQLHL
ncbi:MAG: hypothetical protein COV10_03110 [Candidatus Vogelbacteria bacterium CG10_big_fil_rev_8_21_14_0_10_51_16]|uniref:Endolytic murein transglycosylase n=1 Tax=Candidatus Vogelbacteria bacterium CG10_big_fil_rev_8_21_14_0_10_51_16 TaxID=1975045 RepID=A0A2H0REA0_9BACT|nr:MAG: hypothetical protein COV10_03110 [Candidatus Vogelbacteria bacterium CG10_big_fil_rev_8_21_14_0_10_51_16]